MALVLLLTNHVSVGPSLVDAVSDHRPNEGTINGSTKTWNPESGNGITETETEYGICERRFQAIDLKKNISAMTIK